MTLTHRSSTNLSFLASEITSDAKPIEKVTLDLGQLLPKSRNFYAYGGSLTTPPCSEGVKWVLWQGIGEVSAAQVTQFRTVTHGDTVRPVQPLGSRQVVKSK